MKSIGFIILFLPSFVIAQMGFEEIRDKVIVLQNSLVNETYVAEQIQVKSNEFYRGQKDKGTIASQLALLYLKVENYDSAFSYINKTSTIKGTYEIMGMKPIIKVIDDDRFLMLLDSSINKNVWENKFGIRAVRNTEFVKEWEKIKLLGISVNDLYNTLYQDMIRAEEVRNLLGEFNGYKLRRSKEMIEEFGLPTYSEHGYNATNTFYVNLSSSAPEILLPYLDKLELLALEKEMNGQLIANFIDQKLILSGQEQRYGTVSVFLSSYKKHVPYPVADIENVDLRRDQLGLEYTLDQLYDLHNAIWWGFH